MRKVYVIEPETKFVLKCLIQDMYASGESAEYEIATFECKDEAASVATLLRHGGGS